MIERTKRLIVDRLGVSRLAAHADRLDAELQDLRTIRDDLLREVEQLRLDLSELALDHERTTTWSRIHVASEWAATAPLLHEPTISIVLPTRDRAHLLRHAIASVFEQSYPNWQLVVVDDGSTDDTPELLASLSGDRVVVGRTDGIGASGARNHGLGLASGDYVAFLDDDNVMMPGWLRAVAEYTGRHPDCDLLYGAQIREIEPGEEHLHGPHGVVGLHLLFVDPFDPERLLDHNYVDLGAVVARRGHPELRFDEQLEVFIDWELFARLSTSSAPSPLPVLAGLYRTGAASRITSAADRDRRLDEMRRRLSELAGT